MGKNEDVATTEETAKPPQMELRTFSLEQLSILKNHPRKDRGNLTSLSKSIGDNGQQEPLIVFQTEEGQYAIIDGVRRFMVFKEKCIDSIHCLIINGISEEQALNMAFIKNTERKSLNAIEIAIHIAYMKETYGYTYDELTIKGYGSKTAISNKLKLLQLPQSIQDQIVDENSFLTEGHAYNLCSLDKKDEQERFAKQIVDHELSVARTKKRIDQFLEKGRIEAKERPTKIIPSEEIPNVYFKDSKNMNELPSKSVHLIVSSPPYNIDKEFEKDIDFTQHMENITAVMQECARVLVSGGIMALNVADIINWKEGTDKKKQEDKIKFMGHLYQSILRPHKIFLTDQIIWRKQIPWRKLYHNSYDENTIHTSYRIMDNWEPIYIFRKEGERESPSGDIKLQSRLKKEQWVAYVNGIWDIDTVQELEEHPCVYPDELVRRLIRMYSYVDDVVLDPFLGSGTTIKVARELGRAGIGYERDIKYKPVIMDKLQVGVEGGQERMRLIKETLTNKFEQADDMEPQKVAVKFFTQQASVEEGELEEAV